MSQAKIESAPDIDEADDSPLSPQYFLNVINSVGTLLAALYDRHSGLTRNQTRIIIALLENDGQTQTELANALSIHKVSVGIYVNEMEALGLVERRTHPTDGRAKCIYLTQLVLANKHVGRNLYAAIHRGATDGIAEKDYLTMLSCMERMRDNLLTLDEDDRKKGSPRLF